LELLQTQIAELVSEGHKVLVFSQFTKLLSLVKKQFDAAAISYEYLDGKTRDRAGCVERFQNDESISAFLISLKAGGSGLNLTAADYVFLLDPWWNPAVEAQAIDRAHRIGQKNPVIAYRMICRDTVEEKIVALQQSKRELADSIIKGDDSMIRSMTADDLQILLT
jgi:SNF2 family DNA or RNA helicase